MTKEENALADIICQAIEEHKILWFYYESSSGEYWRKVDPYILAIKDNGNGNSFFTGYVHPSNASSTDKNDHQGQYLLNKIDMERFKVLDETFDELKLDREKIYGELPTIKIICRVVFESELSH
jgi:hypothetical protein